MNQETIGKYLIEGNKLKRQGKLEEAIVSYKRAIEMNPNSAWSYHNLGETFVKVNRLDEAIISYKRAIEINPNSAWSYYELGEVLAAKENFDSAITNYRRACALAPNFEEFSQRLYNALEKLKNSQPLTISEYYKQGMEWIEKKQLEKAILSYEKVLKNLPIAAKEAEKYLSLGVALVKLGQLDRVIDCYDRVFHRSVSNLKLYYQFSICLSGRELITEAVKFFQEIPQPPPPKKEQKKGSDRREIYDVIWDLCNWQDSSNIEEEIPQNKPIERAAAYQYFSQHKPDQTFTSSPINESEKSTLKDLGISLEYLELLEKEDRELENIYINSYDKSSPDIIKK